MAPPALGLTHSQRSLCVREVSAVIPERPPASSAPSTWSCQVRGGGGRVRSCGLFPQSRQRRGPQWGGQTSPATPLAPLDRPLPCFGCLQLLYGGIIYISRISLVLSVRLNFVHFLVNLQSCRAITTIQFNNISITPRKIPCTHLRLLPVPPPAPGNH